MGEKKRTVWRALVVAAFALVLLLVVVAGIGVLYLHYGGRQSRVEELHQMGWDRGRADIDAANELDERTARDNQLRRARAEGRPESQIIEIEHAHKRGGAEEAAKLIAEWEEEHPSKD